MRTATHGMSQEDLNAKDQPHFLYKQVLPPSGVNHCCQAFLTHPLDRKVYDLPNVIVVRYNLLQVYRPRQSVRDEEKCWLELLTERQLQGTVESLAVLPSRAPGVQRDSILLTFRDAKAVVLVWDELLGDLQTASMHCWEDNPYVTRSRPHAPPLGPQTYTDPQGRCAAVLLYSNHIALLPTVRADIVEADADSPGLTQSARLEKGYTVALSKLGIKEARDVCLLHRYNEPVLLVLHESSPTWAGSLVERKDTMCLTAFSLNLNQEKNLRLWHAEGLPSDAHKLIPVPLGGALVLCQSLILYQSQGVSCALAVNSKAYAGVVPPFIKFTPREAPSVTAARHASKFSTNIEPDAAASAAKGAPRAEGFELDVQHALGVWLTPTTLLMSLESGQNVLLILEVSGGSVRRLKLEKAKDGTRASCLCRVGPSWIFMGSWLGDSLLLHARSADKPKKQLQLEAPKQAILAIEGPQSNQHGTAKSPVASQSNQSEGNAKGAGEQHTISQHDLANGSDKALNLPAATVDAKTEQDERNGADIEDSAVPASEGPNDEVTHAAKKQKLDSDQAAPATVADEPEVDEFESLFQSIETARISTLKLAPTRFTFKVVDRLFALGPITSLVPVDLKNSTGAMTGSQKYVAGTGHGKSGALVTLTQLIQPEILSTSPLTGIRGMWAVRFKPEGLPWDLEFGYHTFLILTIGHTTKVLQTGERLTEMKAEQIGFCLDKPTLLAANLLSLARTVQVCADRIVFLAGSSRQSETTVRDLLRPPSQPTGVQGAKAAEAAQPENLANVEIMAASVEDPYVLLHLSNGSAVILTASLDSGRLEVLQAARENLHEVPAADVSSHITACALHQDRSGWLSNHSEVQATVFAVICNAKHLLQIFALPIMQLVFDHCPVTEGSPVLSGDPIVEATISKDRTEEDGQGDGDPDLSTTRPIVIEVKMESFQDSKDVVYDDEASEQQEEEFQLCERPVLVMLLSDGGMLTYQAFSSPIGLKFTRLRMNWLSHAEGRTGRGASQRLTRFDGLGEHHTYSGIFISGYRPLWLIAARGGLIPHGMETGGFITAMTPFNNLNCPQGFITVEETGSTGSLNIVSLPSEFRLDFAWPYKRVAAGNTISNLSFLTEYNLFCCSITRIVPHQEWLKEEEGGELAATYAYMAAQTLAKEHGKEKLAQVRLMGPSRFETVWRLDMMPAEQVLCVKCLALHNSHTSVTENLLIIGTAFSYGEDYPCTGRILVIGLERSQREVADGTSVDSWNHTLLYQREVQGPAMALAAVEGLLLVGWGSRLESYAWNGQRLQTTCFHEAQVLITSISHIKRFVVLGDMRKGITFLRLSEDSHSFQSLSKDFDNCDVLASEFLIQGKSKLFVLVGDAAQNLRVFSYQLEHPHSWQGKRMIPVGTFHCGFEIAGVVSRKIEAEGVTVAGRGALCYGLDGSIATIMPLWQDELAPPLRALRRLLETSVLQVAGLNPRSYRERFSCIPSALGGGECWSRGATGRTIVDGDLLWQFQHLSHARQAALSTKLGLKMDQTLTLLDSIAYATA